MGRVGQGKGNDTGFRFPAFLPSPGRAYLKTPDAQFFLAYTVESDARRSACFCRGGLADLSGSGSGRLVGKVDEVCPDQLQNDKMNPPAPTS